MLLYSKVKTEIKSFYIDHFRDIFASSTCYIVVKNLGNLYLSYKTNNRCVLYDTSLKPVDATWTGRSSMQYFPLY